MGHVQQDYNSHQQKPQHGQEDHQQQHAIQQNNYAAQYHQVPQQHPHQQQYIIYPNQGQQQVHYQVLPQQQQPGQLQQWSLLRWGCINTAGLCKPGQHETHMSGSHDWA